MTDFLLIFSAMRIFAMLCKNKPQNPLKVPLAKPRLPLALRDRVSTRRTKGGSVPALQELQNLINKLAQNDFNQDFCKNEIIAMRNASTAAHEKSMTEREENRAGNIKPGANLNPVPLNKYLKKFPVVKANPFEAKIVELPEWKRKR